MSSLFHISASHVQKVLHSIPHIQSVNICTAHVQTCTLVKIYTARCLVSTPHLLLMSSQYTTSPAHVRSIDYLFYLCPVRIQPLLPITSQSPSSTANVQSVILSCPHLVRIPPLFIQLNYHLCYPCPVRIHFSGHMLSVTFSCSQILSAYHLS